MNKTGRETGYNSLFSNFKQSTSSHVMFWGAAPHILVLHINEEGTWTKEEAGIGQEGRPEP